MAGMKLVFGEMHEYSVDVCIVKVQCWTPQVRGGHQSGLGEDQTAGCVVDTC